MICEKLEIPLRKFKKNTKIPKECDPKKLITLHRPTAVSKFKKSVPRPDYRPVKNAPPVWEARDLNEKIPMYSECRQLVLHKGLIGNNPYKSKMKLQFSLSDPYCREIPYTYNPLHDPNLNRWLSSDNNRKFLLKQGLITADNEAVCDLKEYNEYRLFLWRQHNDLTRRLLREKEEKQLEQRRIHEADLRHKREIAKKINRLKYILSKNKPQNHVSSTV